MFSDGYGFVVDYLAKSLRSLRNHDYSDRCREYFSLSADISTRDRNIIQKKLPGQMNLLFSHCGAAKKDEVADHLVTIEGEFKGDQLKKNSLVKNLKILLKVGNMVGE